MDQDSESDALEWRAFRYVAGEMAGDEARELEAQMATDQAVREAVSRAATLAVQLAEARPSPEPVVTTIGSVAERNGKWSWQLSAALACGALATAASVAFFLGVHWARHDALNPQMIPPQIADSRRTDVAVDADTWLQLRHMNDTESQVGRSWDEWDTDESVHFEIDRGPVVPAWLVELAGANQSKGKP